METLLMDVEDAKDSEAEIWHVDTDCSNHMSGSQIFSAGISDPYSFSYCP